MRRISKSPSVFADEQFLGSAFVNPGSNIFARIFARDEIALLDEKYFAQKFEIAEKSIPKFPYSFL